MVSNHIPNCECRVFCSPTKPLRRDSLWQEEDGCGGGRAEGEGEQVMVRERQRLTLDANVDGGGDGGEEERTEEEGLPNCTLRGVVWCGVV